MMRFVKYEGCGNDFVVVDEAELESAYAGIPPAASGAVSAAEVDAKDNGAPAISGADLASLARRVCHRRLGVGADGLIICRRAPLTMNIINSDGSVAPMCGNGIRCFARYCVEEGIVAPDAGEFDVQTLAGVMRARVSAGEGFTAEIAMGRPDWSARAAGSDVSYADKIGEFLGRGVSVGAYGETCGGADVPEAEENGSKVRLSSFFLGTYHTVVWLDENEWILAGRLDGSGEGTAGAQALYESEVIDRVGRALESHPVFTKRTNVDFARVRDRRTVEMITWERGAGLTAACGTGACSVFALGVREGRLDGGGEVRVELPYGELFIRQNESGEIFMRGPAERVFEGRIEPVVPLRSPSGRGYLQYSLKASGSVGS
jgi:diaminopimelate epimerase